ncbi:four helix bundle protein [Salinibacter sp.]|jgi:four helix bundle protein|uniref:four helix bundle protein n=1 Tax=Salinibacter sp. TaxID=2065818 RepID=UPI0021E740EC|nr:four helix bundle protein [Salinibacter sp.]
MAYKFEDLEVWTRALDYSDQVHDIAQRLPKHERYNLADQITRAANNRLCLNVASS